MKHLITFFLILFSFSFFNSFAQSKLPRLRYNKAISKNIKYKKKLVYLYTANGGLIGYFSDSSIVSCIRCDFCKSNILAMFKDKSTVKWNLIKPSDFISYEKDNGWVLVNHKWNEKVPQF